MDKEEYIKRMIKRRVSITPGLFIDNRTIDRLSGLELYSMPESTIVSIVELYVGLKNMNIPDKEIFQQFELMRPGSGRIPLPLNLKTYVYYRIQLEHNDNSGLNRSYVNSAVDASYSFFANNRVELNSIHNGMTSSKAVPYEKSKKSIRPNINSTKGVTTPVAILQSVGLLLSFMAPFMLAAMVAGITDNGTAAVTTFLISMIAWFIIMNKY